MGDEQYIQAFKLSLFPFINGKLKAFNGLRKTLQ